MCDDDVAEVSLVAVVVVVVTTAPHHQEPVRGVWTKVVDGDRGRVDTDLVHAQRLPIGIQAALLLVPRHAHTPATTRNSSLINANMEGS